LILWEHPILDKDTDFYANLTAHGCIGRHAGLPPSSSLSGNNSDNENSNNNNYNNNHSNEGGGGGTLTNKGEQKRGEGVKLKVGSAMPDVTQFSDLTLDKCRAIWTDFQLGNAIASGARGFKLDEDDVDVNIGFVDSAVFPGGLTGAQYHNIQGFILQKMYHDMYVTSHTRHKKSQCNVGCAYFYHTHTHTHTHTHIHTYTPPPPPLQLQLPPLPLLPSPPPPPPLPPLPLPPTLPPPQSHNLCSMRAPSAPSCSSSAPHSTHHNSLFVCLFFFWQVASDRVMASGTPDGMSLGSTVVSDPWDSGPAMGGASPQRSSTATPQQGWESPLRGSASQGQAQVYGNNGTLFGGSSGGGGGDKYAAFSMDDITSGPRPSDLAPIAPAVHRFLSDGARLLQEAVDNGVADEIASASEADTCVLMPACPPLRESSVSVCVQRCIALCLR
jgi:hypothetical protein